jgi:hypothetical protein
MCKFNLEVEFKCKNSTTLNSSESFYYILYKEYLIVINKKSFIIRFQKLVKIGYKSHGKAKHFYFLEVYILVNYNDMQLASRYY